MSPNNLHQTAKSYLAAGLSVLPASKANKRPSNGNWKTFQSRFPTECELNAWFSNSPDALCVLAGGVSGNLEVIDFDNHGELYAAWTSQIDPELLDRLVIETTPSGGYHVAYRCECAVAGNLKLAQGMRSSDDGEKLTTLVETRGEGGLVLCAPTDGYTLIHGEYTALPTLSLAERNSLLDAATDLDERTPETAPSAPATSFSKHSTSVATPTLGTRPGDDFNARGDIRPLLVAHGWTKLREDATNEYWRRPGKTDDGNSATFNGAVFNVFSSNAYPFEGGTSYSKFSVYTLLEHGGDPAQAAASLRTLGYGADNLPPVDISAFMAKIRTQSPNFILPVEELMEHYPDLRKPIIHGFLRRGETMNIIAPPKTGKSWLVTDLALSIALGRDWFGFPCEQGKVLIIDNELHPETSAHRIPSVMKARDVSLDDIRDKLYIENQRGRLQNINDLGHRLEELKPYGFRVIIIDAFYRAMPIGTDENDNGAVAGVYNLLDRYAAILDCAFILIHHTSKGNQAIKSVTDVGAGAGSQSRATDAHVILRRHQEEGAVVMDSVVRSFQPVSPICLRWSWPVWNRDDELDAALLDGIKVSNEEPEEEPSVDELALQVAEIADENPTPKTAFIARVRNKLNLSKTSAREAVELAITLRLVTCARDENADRSQRSTLFIRKAESPF